MQMLRWIGTVIILLFIYRVRQVFPPFIIGAILAYLLYPLVSRIRSFKPGKYQMPIGLAVLIVYVLIGGIISALTYRFGPTLRDDVTSLISQRHQIVTNLVSSVSTQFHWQVDVQQTSQDLLSNIEGGIATPSEIMHLGGLLSHGMLAVLVCIVSSIYFLVDSNRIGQFLLRFVPENSRKRTVNMVGQMNLMLSKYVVGQIALIVIMALVAFLFLSFKKIKYALLIAVLSGFFEIIPYLGPAIAIASATIVGVSQFGIQIAPQIILFYLIARWLEDYFVQPTIIGHAVELHGLAVIFAVLCGEVMAGALGMLIAIPVAAAIKLIVDNLLPPTLEEKTLSDTQK